jgi:hypothetical protein
MNKYWEGLYLFEVIEEILKYYRYFCLPCLYHMLTQYSNTRSYIRAPSKVSILISLEVTEIFSQSL